ncbi:hypothetical protein NIES4101_28900 [Calothrix sp. NIES-4101]|nr:hypothetical protein NIES4101_28900 [Calothrix sp. NIES-4101]
MANSCDEIDAALGRLGNKIDGLGKRLDALEKEQARCCKDKGNSVDLSSIYKRLAELESAVRQLANYVNTTDKAIKTANKSLQFIVNLFNF